MSTPSVALHVEALVKAPSISHSPSEETEGAGSCKSPAELSKVVLVLAGEDCMRWRWKEVEVEVEVEAEEDQPQ